MRKLSKSTISKASKILRSGGVGVLPTDTIYGIVGSALDKKAVARVYRLRRRIPNKPMIILIGDVSDLLRFGIAVDAKLVKTLKRFWPGKVSVVLECDKGHGTRDRGKETVNEGREFDKFRYLHRGEGSLAFRLPRPLWLRKLLQETGPLVAPSANHQGQPAAKTIREAKKYFGSTVGFYMDVGQLASKPSTIIKIEKGKVIVLRK